MWYFFNATDTENSLAKRLKHRPEHIARLTELINAGRLLVAGAYPAIDNVDPGQNGFKGSLIIAEFDCIEDAQNWAKKEPFLLHGVYSDIDIKLLKKSLP